MAPRSSRGLLIVIMLILVSGLPVVFARPGRGGGGRGGGGGGARGGGGGGMPRGGGMGGGGMGGGGGISRSPGVSAPRPTPRPSPGGGQPGGGRPGGPQLGGGRPGGPGPGQGNRPGGIDNRPGGAGGIANRPGGAGGAGGIANRPGIDNRPGGIGGAGGIANRPGIDNRPGGVGGAGGIGNRPGIDNRPGGAGGIANRPGIDNRPGGVGGAGGIANRPGIDNRPGGVGGIGGIGGAGGVAGVGNRSGINNRQISGSGNTINGGDVNVGGIRQNNLAGVGVDPGYGVRPPAYNNWRGASWGYHQGWANGYWHGYHDNNYSGWGWGRFAAGAVGVTAWALGSSFYNWGYASYANPYYAEPAAAQPIVIEQTVYGGEPQTVSVPALAYDYNQPVDTLAAPPPAEVADPALAKFEAARGEFRNGDYAGALRLVDEALQALPNDATLHEFRALVLFAVGKYDLAAGPLYSVLSVGPGWDWTTMAGLYPSVDVYTKQVRALEAFIGATPTSTAGRFVLAYHYLTQGHIDPAVSQLKQVMALAPQDTLSAQLVRQFAKPGTEPAAVPPAPPATATEAPAKPGTLPGNWTARPSNDTTVRLSVADDGSFTWKVDSRGKPQELKGKWSLADDLLTLAQSGQGGALVGRVTWQAGTRWNFRVIGAGPDDQGLSFTH